LHFEVERGLGEHDADMIESNGGRKDDDGSDEANKDREDDTDGKGNEMDMDGANGHTDKEDSINMEINENEGHKGKQVALHRSEMEFKFGAFVSQVKLSGTKLSTSDDLHKNTNEIPILPVQKHILDDKSMMFSDADLDTILVLPKYFGGEAKKISEKSDVAQEEHLLSLLTETGYTGKDTAKTEFLAAKLSPMLRATTAPSSPRAAAESVKCMRIDEESLHRLSDSASSLHVTRDKVKNNCNIHSVMQSSNEITSPFLLLQNVVQQTEDGHISLDEQIKTGQSNTTTVHTSDVAKTNVKFVAKSTENEDDVHKNVQSGTSHFFGLSDMVPNNTTVTVDVTNNLPLSVSPKPSVEDVVAFGGIPCPAANEVRISKRIGAQSDADLTQMERAMKKTQLRNSVNSGNHIPKFSILSIPDTEIKERANRMGISLGKSFDEVASSINGIKNREGERTLLIMQKNADEISNEGSASLIVSRASNLCEDLLDDEDIHADLVDHFKQTEPIKKEKKQRRRKVYDLSNVRKSTRKIIKKQYS
jgi:hypothetical protein